MCRHAEEERTTEEERDSTGREAHSNTQGQALYNEKDLFQQPSTSMNNHKSKKGILSTLKYCKTH